MRLSQWVVEPPTIPPGPTGCLVVEFAGTPRAGKTSAVHGLRENLHREGHRVQIVEESADGWPFSSKRHPHFNLWTATATSARMIEAIQADVDIVLVDRGLFDALCWMEWYRRSNLLTRYEHHTIDRFLRMPRLREMIHLVLVMTVDPAEAIRREVAARPPGQGHGPGTIVNPETLRDLNASIAARAARHRSEFSLRELDTTAMSREQTLEAVARAVHRLIPA